MSAKRFYHVLSILLGYALIIGGFVVFGVAMDPDVRLLDIVVACVVFTQVVLMSAFPIVDVGRRAHREVGMLGAHYVAVSVYSVLAVGFIVAGVLLAVPFVWQIMAQGVALFLLIAARVVVLHAGDAVERVAGREEALSSAKASVQSRLDALALAARRAKGFATGCADRVERIAADARFFSPSLKPEARQADNALVAQADEVRSLLASPNVDADRLAEALTELELLVEQRRKY